MFGINNLAKHMKEKHPNSKYFGDRIEFDNVTGKIKSQICQFCGEELVKKGENYEK